MAGHFLMETAKIARSKAQFLLWCNCAFKFPVDPQALHTQTASMASFLSTTITISLLLLTAVGSLRADLQGGPESGRSDDRRRESPRPQRSIAPLPQDVTAEVQRGRSTAIILSAKGKHGETVEFLVREEPNHGELGEMRRLGLNTVEIPYKHSGENTAAEDRFTYAAQSRGTAISARATVTIKIRERPGRLEIPDELDYGEVVAGETAERNLLLGNSGTGTLMTGLRLPPDFRLLEADPAHIILPPDTEKILRLEFAPERPGAYRDPILYRDEPGVYTMLKAKAVPPLEVDLDRLELKRGDEGITGTIPVKNRSRSSRSVKADTLRPLVVTPGIVVSAGESGTITVTAPGSHPTGLTGEVALSGDHFSHKVKVVLPALPAELMAPESLEITENDSQGALLRLKNTGGEPYRQVKLDFSPPYFIAQGPEFPLALGPGEEISLRIGHSGDARGHEDNLLKILSGDQEVHKIELVTTPARQPAREIPAAAAAASESGSGDRQARQARSASRASSSGDRRGDRVAKPTSTAAGKPAVRRSSNSRIIALRELLEDYPVDPLAHDFRLLERGNNHARLTFRTEGRFDKMTVEQRLLKPGNEDIPVLVDWVQWPEAEITRENEGYLLHIGDLPKEPMVIRLVKEDEVFSAPYRIPGRAPADFSFLWWLLLVMIIAAGAWLLWRRQRAAAE